MISKSITDLKGSGITGSYPSYTTVSDIESHVLWRRLIEKRNQFSLATEEFPRVLFVCDAGCSALTDPYGGASDYKLDEVIGHFWRRPQKNQPEAWLTEKDISGIIDISIEQVSRSTFNMVPRQFILKARLFQNPHCSYPLDDSTIKLLNEVITQLPAPIESPSNSLRALSVNNLSSRRSGGFTLKENVIEMSGVDLLRILSGDLSLDEFWRKYSFDSNPFKDAIQRYQTIKSIRVEPIPDRDDDRIIMEFGSHDAAIGPFKPPNDEPDDKKDR